MVETAEPDEQGSNPGSNGEPRGQATSESSGTGASESQQNAAPKGDNGSRRPTTVNGASNSEHASSDLKTTAKFLVSNSAAGSIIGKGGSNINELQRTSAAKLQLSRASEFFPGTSDRVLTATGSISQLVSVLTLILTTCLDESEEGENTDQELRFLAPSAVCGILIGKAGTHIKGYARESGASITVSSMHDQLPGVSERVVTITGEIDEVVTAVRLILEKLQESKHYSRLASVPVNYQSGAMEWRGQRMPIAMPGQLPMLPAPVATDPNLEAEVSLQVPDTRIGAIIGKGGEIITQIKNLFDVNVRISDRESFVPGTRDREITIRGAPPRVHLANQLIHERINAAELSSSPATSRRR